MQAALPLDCRPEAPTCAQMPGPLCNLTPGLPAHALLGWRRNPAVQPRMAAMCWPSPRTWRSRKLPVGVRGVDVHLQQGHHGADLVNNRS